MQSLNPFLILVLVPLFKGVIYPSVSALGYRLTPLRCMSAGMVCTGLAFVVIAAIQVHAGSSSAAAQQLHVVSWVQARTHR